VTAKIQTSEGSEQMQYDNLPKELRDNGKFCLWKYEERKGKVKPDKVPYQISGKHAQSNNESTFSEYANAVAAVSLYDGLGLGIFRGFSAVDVDHCVNTDGTLAAIGQSAVNIFKGCYIEISPSGTGLRVIFKASGFKYDVAKYYINNTKLGVEVYVSQPKNMFLLRAMFTSMAMSLKRRCSCKRSLIPLCSVR